MRFLQSIFEWMSKPEVRDKILAGFLAAILGSLFFWLLNKTMRLSNTVGRRLLKFARRGHEPLNIQLENYRLTLDRQLFRIQHSWMKEGQTLQDILVPVIIESDRLVGGIEDWSILLSRYFHPSRNTCQQFSPRLAIIGGPGAGKSVALKLAAREAWNFPSSKTRDALVPVLFTFSEYRRSGFDLVKTIERSLEARGFRPFASTQGTEGPTFVDSKLLAGKLLLLIDALDELDRDDRKRATDSLIADLKRFSSAPVILSCRTAAWHNQFAEVIPEVIEMADFTPTAIRQFLRRWLFPPPKTSHELLDAIESQPHIGELARSPLMLTIVAFLYSQPKYHLPENRAEFYDICSRALLEEWDQHRNPDRANRFDRHHKEYVLSELAYRHLCGPNPDADLDERGTLETIAKVMGRYSLKESENLRMLDEILENSGLLIRLPPSGLRFPHQTFLEFFAALYLIRQGDQAQVFEHYSKDPERWREVLLLYIGLDTNAEDASLAITRLFESDSLEMALSALVDSRATKPAVSEVILKKCSERLEYDLEPKLITLLGYISSNPRTSHADRAGEILKELLGSVAKRRPPPLILEALLLASLRRPSEETTRFVVEHLNDLQLGRVLPQMGERAFVLTSKIMGNLELSLAKKLEWIDGLRRAVGIKPLFQILNQPQFEDSLRNASAVALSRLSHSLSFGHEVEDCSANETWIDASTVSALKRWGWPFKNPVSEQSRRFMIHLATRLALHSDREPVWKDVMSNEVDPRLIYLMNALSREIDGRAILTDPMYSKSHLFILRSIWRAVRSKQRIAGIRDSVDLGVLEIVSPLTLLGLYVWSALSVILGPEISLGLIYPRGYTLLWLALIAGIVSVAWEGVEGPADILFGAIVGPSFLFREIWRAPALFGLATLVGAGVMTLMVSLWVSDSTPIRIAFVFVLGSQIVASGGGSSVTPAHPILANERTLEMCEHLLKADRA